MYRPRDDMTKTTKGDKNAPDDPYLPIPGSLPDRFMRSYTKLMRHPRSRPARETARATFPHYIADVLDRHCADAYPDDNPADQAGLDVGSRVQMQTLTGTYPVEVVGVARFGESGSIAGAKSSTSHIAWCPSPTARPPMA